MSEAHARTYPYATHHEITVNGKKVEVPGTPIAEIKRLAEVPAAFELEIVVAGSMHPLPDDGAIALKGCEQFVAHPREGASS